MRWAPASDCVAMRGCESAFERVRRCENFCALAMRALMSASVQWWLWRLLRSSTLRARKALVGTLALVSESEAV